MTTSRRRSLIGLAMTAVMPWPQARAAGITLHIRTEFSTDPGQTGTMRLEDEGGRLLAGPFPAYGRADTEQATRHGNPGRSPLLPYGDTPTGTFAIPRAVATGAGTRYAEHSYGPNGALVLRPTGGAALTAAVKRIGLLIHGGDPGKGGVLRATHGCVRLSDADMLRLMQAIARAGENSVFGRCEVTRIDASIGLPGDPMSGDDAGDPPPGIQGLLSPGPIVLRGPVRVP